MRSGSTFSSLSAVLGLACLLAPASSGAGREKQRRIWLWCDGEANWASLNSPERVAAVLDKSARAGVTDIVVDVKLISGEVHYKSRIAPRVREWNKVRLPDENFDRLAVFLKEGRRRGLRVHASMNVFSEAHKHASPPRGVLLAKRDWQTILYTPQGLKPTLEVDQGPGGYAGFVNPIIPEVQDYELSIVRELAENYSLDGIVFDRMRYDDLYSDFSDLSRREFEGLVGSLERWPQDIFEIDSSSRITQGKFFKQWIQWRAGNIKRFLARARALVKGVKPAMEVNVYVGSWYPLYYDVGVNWASPDFKAGFDWMTPDYHKTGYAELVDHLLTGCYYPDVTIQELREKKEEVVDRLTGAKAAKPDYYSVEGGCDMSRKAAAGAAPVYASLYILDYFNDGLKDPSLFKKAIAMCLKKTDGIMLFDLVYIEKHGLWKLLRASFKS